MKGDNRLFGLGPLIESQFGFGIADLLTTVIDLPVSPPSAKFSDFPHRATKSR